MLILHALHGFASSNQQKDNSICKFPASVRSHGDLNDHLELINGNLISSLNINLKKGNIDNITKFILFVPK